MFFVQKLREANILPIIPNIGDITITITDQNNLYCYDNSGEPFKVTDIVSYKNPLAMEADTQHKGKIYIVESTKDIFYNDGSENISILDDIKENIFTVKNEVDFLSKSLDFIIQTINKNYVIYEERLSQLEGKTFTKDFKASIDLTLIQNGKLEVPILVDSFLFDEDQTIALVGIEATSLEDLEDINIKVYHTNLTETLIINKTKNSKRVTANVDSSAITHVKDGYYTVELTGISEAKMTFLNITLVFNRIEDYHASIATPITLVPIPQ